MSQSLFMPLPTHIPKRVLPVDLVGAGRAATHLIPFLAHLNSTSMALTIRPNVISPRADELARISDLAASLDLAVITTEAKAEDVLATSNTTDPIIAAVDQSAVGAYLLRAAARQHRAIQLYLFMQIPGRPLTLIAAIFTRYEDQLKLDLAAFLSALARFTTRSGSSALFGDAAPSANLDIEPAMRAWLNDHLAENLLKVIVDLEPNATPLQLVLGGESRPLVIVESPDGLRDVSALEADLPSFVRFPLERGKDFVIAEVAPDRIRFHPSRLRTDGRLVIRDRGRKDVDASSFRPPTPAASVDTQTIHRFNPVYTSD